MRFFLRFILATVLIGGSAPSSLSAQEIFTWQDSLREAAKNNPDLILAQEDIIQSQAGKIITTSVIFPQISADVNASTASDSTGSSKNFSYGVSGSQLVFNGLKTPNNIRAASENIKAAQENFKFTSASVRFRLREAFVNLLKAQESLILTEEIYKIRRENVELITLRYESGTEHRGALLTAKANLAQAEFEVNQAQRNREAAQRQLIKEMGRKQISDITVTGDLKVKDEILQKPDFEAIVLRNPSFLKLVAQKNASAFDVKSVQGDFWPEVALSADVSKSDNHWPPQEQGASAGLRVSVPLFEGGARFANLTRARSVYRQFEEQLRSTKDKATLALEQAWNALKDAVENVRVQKAFIDAAQERASIAEQQYSVGLISFDNWTIIEDDLVRNKKSFLNTRANALLAEASWIQAKGETLEYEK